MDVNKIIVLMVVIIVVYFMFQAYLKYAEEKAKQDNLSNAQSLMAQQILASSIQMPGGSGGGFLSGLFGGIPILNKIF